MSRTVRPDRPFPTAGDHTGRVRSPAPLLVAALFGLTACGAASTQPSDDTAAETASDDTASPTSIESEVTVTTEPSEPATSTTTTTARPESTTTSDPSGCESWITVGDAEVGRWFVVNDDVMGGQSLGGLLIDGDRLVFSGSVNNDGGGFSSIRRHIEDGELDGWGGVRLHATGDGRTYQFRARDLAEGRNSRVTHRAEIMLGPGPSNVVVRFADMVPGVFGRDVDDTPLEAGRIDWIGVMIADGVDGAFEAAITAIDRCP